MLRTADKCVAVRRQMNIQDLGALGELIAALAVFASLLFVGYQLRQSGRRSIWQPALDLANGDFRFHLKDDAANPCSQAPPGTLFP